MAEWTRGRFVNEYVPGLFTVGIDTYLTKRAEGMGMKLVTVKKSEKKSEEDAIRSGLGRPVEKVEGTGINYDVQIGGAKQTWVHKVYALGIRITEEAIEDNLYELKGGSEGELKEIFHDLGEAMAENLESNIAKFFNYGTATTYHTTRNGKALFATDHPRLDGSTYQNYATNADLTYLTFWSCLASAENQYNHRQYRIAKKVKTLWVPPQYERAAREILYSTDRPDSANRAISALKQSGRKIELNVWPHLTDTDAFYLQLDGRGIIFFWRRKTRFAKEGDFQTGDMMCKADQRWSAEIADEQDFYGNIPA
jgi:phage major head subunit gpT-like protein